MSIRFGTKRSEVASNAGPMAHRYGFASIDEARAYLRHPLLRPRLVECTKLMLGHRGRRDREILGSPDDPKLRSSMTLFAEASDDDPSFRAVLDRFYAGQPDERTLALLNVPRLG